MSTFNFTEKKSILEKLAIESMRHENVKAEIFNEDRERFTSYETQTHILDENNVSCSQVKIFGDYGTIKEYIYYLDYSVQNQ